MPKYSIVAEGRVIKTYYLQIEADTVLQAEQKACRASMTAWKTHDTSDDELQSFYIIEVREVF